MTVLECGIGDWTPRAMVPSVPAVEVEPPRAPVQPGQAGEQWLVAVADFPVFKFRGVLWDARIEAMPSRARSLGGNALEISVPATSTVMRIIGTPVPGAFDENGDQLYSLPNVDQLELLVGSTLDGRVRRHYVVRDEVTVERGRIRIPAVGFIGGLTADRIIGAPTRLNLITTNASFEQGALNGWRVVGDAEVDFESGGPDGDTFLRVRGTPGAGWVERRVRYSQPVRPWGRQRIAGQALVRLPNLSGIDDYGLVTIAVFEGGTQVWPDERRGDPEAGVVTSDMGRGSWMSDYVVGVGYLPTPPFTADVYLRLHPVSESEWTDFDDASIFRRESTSTVNPVDLVRHPGQLFEHAQGGRAKSDWGITVVTGEATGVEEVGTWWHEDGQSLNDALEALCGRGLDVWDLPGPGRRVIAAKRQGQVRTDVAIQEWSVLGRVRWSVDAGARRTTARAVSSAGSLWGGADEGAVDPRVTSTPPRAPAIDVTLQAPVGMTPNQLRSWLLNQLASLQTLTAGTSLLVPYELGMRLEVGDSVRVALRSKSAVLVEWQRITEHAPDPAGRFVALVAGTDPDLEGGS